MDGQVEWVGYRDLEDGVSPDSQPKGGYLGHAQALVTIIFKDPKTEKMDPERTHFFLKI